jgi:phosphopantetheine adenylyltransferase
VRINDRELTLGASSDFVTETYLDSNTLETLTPTQNTIYYIPNQTDSFITSNTIQNDILRINGNDIINFND